MKKAIHSDRCKASALRKSRAGRSAHIMNPEYLAVIDNFRLMDDTFMSKCLENAPECIDMCEAMERIAERREARGKRETMLATAKRMLKDGILALKDVARYSGLSLVQVKKPQASMA